MARDANDIGVRAFIVTQRNAGTVQLTDKDASRVNLISERAPRWKCNAHRQTIPIAAAVDPSTGRGDNPIDEPEALSAAFLLDKSSRLSPSQREVSVNDLGIDLDRSTIAQRAVFETVRA